MSTRIENLEKLARLRAEGLLTDTEFEAEKAKLLAEPLDGEDHEIANGDDHDQIDPGEARFKFGRWAWGIAIVFLLGSMALAWDRFGLGGDSMVAGGQGVIDQLGGADPLWVKSETVDAMTDVNVVSLKRSFEVGGFNIETTISCRSDKVVIYNFKTFNADGSGAEAVSQLYNYTVGYYHAATFRPDDKPAAIYKYVQPRYNNVFEFEQSYAKRPIGTLYLDPAFDLIRADKLAVQLHLKQGEPTFVIDQSDETVSSVLAGCSVPTEDGLDGPGLSHNAGEVISSWALKSDNGSPMALYGGEGTSASFALDCLTSERQIEYAEFDVEKPAIMDGRIAAGRGQEYQFSGFYNDDDEYTYFGFRVPVDSELWTELATGSSDLTISLDGVKPYSLPRSPVLSDFVSKCRATM
jgi:Short C-terminal domain